ncbi:MAG: hypothetical protein IH945_02125 [Armatimonadetes bacterium]|nr:hypothetical protein [Armatimonadota bacterium]
MQNKRNARTDSTPALRLLEDREPALGLRYFGHDEFPQLDAHGVDFWASLIGQLTDALERAAQPEHRCVDLMHRGPFGLLDFREAPISDDDESEPVAGYSLTVAIAGGFEAMKSYAAEVIASACYQTDPEREREGSDAEYLRGRGWQVEVGATDGRLFLAWPATA